MEALLGSSRGMAARCVYKHLHSCACEAGGDEAGCMSGDMLTSCESVLYSVPLAGRGCVTVKSEVLAAVPCICVGSNSVLCRGMSP